MGLAIIWIAIRHSNFPFTVKAIAFVLDRCGHGGVDMFLFLSSFGLYYAYKKEHRYWPFIKRRLLRVLPYSMTMCVVLLLFGKRTWEYFLIDFFGLSIFLRDNWTWWYTSFILFMYFLTPLYLRFFNKKPLLSTLIGMSVVSVICYLLPSYQYVYIYFRINIFLLGFVFAYLNENKKDFKCWWLVIVMVFGWVLMYYFYHHFGNENPPILPFIFIIPGLVLFSAWIIDKVTFLQKPLDFIGIYTYQFYLIHEDLFAELLKHWSDWYHPGIHFDFWINIQGIVMAFIFAIIFKKVIDYIMDMITNRLKRV